MLFVRMVGTRKLHQLYFLKLMLPDDPAYIFAIRTGFTAEARRISGDGDREPGGVYYFVTIEIGQRHFRRRDQPKVMIGGL